MPGIVLVSIVVFVLRAFLLLQLFFKLFEFLFDKIPVIFGILIAGSEAQGIFVRFKGLFPLINSFVGIGLNQLFSRTKEGIAELVLCFALQFDIICRQGLAECRSGIVIKVVFIGGCAAVVQ